MRVSTRQINWFLMAKLPSAFLCGVRLKLIDKEVCVVKVRHRWINQNPFKSMYFAVQSMAAELSTGAHLFTQIRESNNNVSMLVISSKAAYFKKAVGVITFTCTDGSLVSDAISKTLTSGESQTIILKSTGKDEQDETVSEMEFEWSIKPKVPLNLT